MPSRLTDDLTAGNFECEEHPGQPWRHDGCTHPGALPEREWVVFAYPIRRDGPLRVEEAIARTALLENARDLGFVKLQGQPFTIYTYAVENGVEVFRMVERGGGRR